MKLTNNEIKIVFIDLDGTLLRNHKLDSFNKEDMEALHQLQEQGIYVVITTGRNEKESTYVWERVRINQYGDFLIFNKGAITTNQYHKVLIEEYCLEQNDLVKLIEYAKDSKTFIKIDDSKNFYTTTKNNKLIYRYFLSLSGRNFHLLNFDKLKLDSNKNYYKAGIVYRWNKKKVLKIANQMRELFPNLDIVISGGGYYIEATNKKANKSDSAKLLLNKLNITKDEAMAFGDSMNDKVLFDLVKYPIAMKNSMNDLFESTDYKTSSVHKAGISKKLKEVNLIK